MRNQLLTRPSTSPQKSWAGFRYAPPVMAELCFNPLAGSDLQSEPLI
jgi:hypothetical protein